MSYSFNELESLIRKAAIGAGLPIGHAYAIAAAGRWLAQRRFPVCDIMATALSCNLGPSEVERLPPSHITFRASRAAMDGLAAVELAIAGGPDVRVALQQLDVAMLVVGLAGRAADLHQASFEVICQSTVVVIGPGSDIAPDGIDACIGMSRGQDLLLTCTTRATQARAALLATRFELASADQANWARLANLAAKTYVPASVESREKGAGAGLIDND